MDTTTRREHHIRQRLGIPDHVEKILIFGESSHWDPNWLYTAEEYFTRFVRNNLDQALLALQQEPRRIYSIECMFFLRMYWEACPEHHDTIRTLVNTGRLRLTSSGVTTADTVIPSTEAILRDLLLGQEWLRTNGMTPEPALAYFTDSFGCTSALPAILNAAGFHYTALTRIDGMYFMGCDLEPAKNFPRPKSSAEQLMTNEKSLDFVWRDPSGAEVLCHWNAFTYGQGDMLAYTGISRVYLAKFAITNRSDRHVARRIDQFVAQLAPLTRTPYLFCPIGFDFVEPIPQLVELLDRYNRNHSARTGVWVVNAGLDDYLQLVDCYRDQLPVLELDPNPYWTGFYTARPTLKQRSRQLVDDLVRTEMLAQLPANREMAQSVANNLATPSWMAATANHHDFITGTSPDDVVDREQLPWLDQSIATVARINAQLTPAPITTPAPVTTSSSIVWQSLAGTVQVQTAHYQLTVSESAGATVTQLVARHSGAVLLYEDSNDLVSYRDSGGLWRMGLEFVGGTWQEATRASANPATVTVQEHETGVELVSHVIINGSPIERRVWLSADSPLIHCRVTGIAPVGHSVVVRLATRLHTTTITMDTAGGLVHRPSTRVYNPTFWPLYQFAHLQDATSGHGLAIIQPLPGALSYQPDGTIELVAMRNANRETAFGFFKLPANPATGYEKEAYTYEYALLFTEQGDWQTNQVDVIANDTTQSPWRDINHPTRHTYTHQLVRTDAPHVVVTTIKTASRGTGVIVRLGAVTVPRAPVRLILQQLTATRAFLCDARERNLHELTLQDGVVQFTMTSTIATIRLTAVNE